MSEREIWGKKPPFSKNCHQPTERLSEIVSMQLFKILRISFLTVQKKGHFHFRPDSRKCYPRHAFVVGFWTHNRKISRFLAGKKKSARKAPHFTHKAQLSKEEYPLHGCVVNFCALATFSSLVSVRIRQIFPYISKSAMS